MVVDPMPASRLHPDPPLFMAMRKRPIRKGTLGPTIPNMNADSATVKIFMEISNSMVNEALCGRFPHRPGQPFAILEKETRRTLKHPRTQKGFAGLRVYMIREPVRDGQSPRFVIVRERPLERIFPEVFQVSRPFDVRSPQEPRIPHAKQLRTREFLLMLDKEMPMRPTIALKFEFPAILALRAKQTTQASDEMPDSLLSRQIRRQGRTESGRINRASDKTPTSHIGQSSSLQLVGPGYHPSRMKPALRRIDCKHGVASFRRVQRISKGVRATPRGFFRSRAP